MKKAKVISAKRSFFMSVLSLVLCFAMLLGTTWAWFTDSVTSGTNKIIAGNLDVELYHKDKGITGEAEKVTETVKLFDDVTLWEPGAYAYETFTIKNVGNLAFKYSMQINAYNATKVGDRSLDEVLKVAVVENAPTSRQTYSNAVPLKGWSLGENEKPLYPVKDNAPANEPSEKTFTVVVYWEPTENDNQWNMNNGNQGKVLSVDLGINLVATQLQYESDSFGPDYDKTAAISLPSIPMTKPLTDTESLKIVVPSSESESPTGVKEATIPAAVANAVFTEVFKETAGDVTDKSLTLVLNVEEKSRNETTFNYDIDMDAVIKEITGTEVTKNLTKSINELGITFTDYVEVKMKVESGLLNVGMKHNGNDMTAVENKAAISNEVVNENGYFHYDETTGDVTLWTKTFSPFTLSGVKPVFKLDAADMNTQYYGTYNSGIAYNLVTSEYLTNDIQNNTGKKFTITLLEDIKLKDNKSLFGLGSFIDSSWFNQSAIGSDNVIIDITLDLNGHKLSGNNTTTYENYSPYGPGLLVFTTTSNFPYLGKNVAVVGAESKIYPRYDANLKIVDTSTDKSGSIDAGAGAVIYVNDANPLKTNSFYDENSVQHTVQYNIYMNVTIDHVNVTGTAINNATSSNNAKYVTTSVLSD